MPRPRLPTEILEMRGTFDDQPGRRRPAAPKSTAPIGDPPLELAPDAAECWRELVAEAAPGVLTREQAVRAEGAERELRIREERDHVRSTLADWTAGGPIARAVRGFLGPCRS